MGPRDKSDVLQMNKMSLWGGHFVCLSDGCLSISYFLSVLFISVLVPKSLAGSK